MQEARDAVEDVTALEETAEDLRVIAVRPIASHLDRVVAGHDREVVAYLEPLEEFVNIRPQEERIAEAERRRKAHRRVGGHVRLCGGTRTVFAQDGGVKLIQLRRGEGREEVEVEGVNLAGALSAVGRCAVGRHVEGLILLVRAQEVVGEGQFIGLTQLEIELTEQRRGVDRFLDRQSFVLLARVLEEVEQRDPLAIGAGIDQSLVGLNRRRLDRARRPERLAQIGARQVAVDLLEVGEEEGPVPFDGSADVAAELFAVEILERFAVGSVRGQSFEALEMEQTAAEFVRARFGDDVNNAAAAAPELSARAGGDDLELLDGLHRDVDRRALAAGLLPEETVVVIAAVEAYVVKDAALAVEIDLVAVRTLSDAHAGSERQQVFKLAAQNGRAADGDLVDRRA